MEDKPPLLFNENARGKVLSQRLHNAMIKKAQTGETKDVEKCFDALWEASDTSDGLENEFPPVFIVVKNAQQDVQQAAISRMMVNDRQGGWQAIEDGHARQPLLIWFPAFELNDATVSTPRLVSCLHHFQRPLQEQEHFSSIQWSGNEPSDLSPTERWWSIYDFLDNHDWNRAKEFINLVISDCESGLCIVPS